MYTLTVSTELLITGGHPLCGKKGNASAIFLRPGPSLLSASKSIRRGAPKDVSIAKLHEKLLSDNVVLA